MACPNIIDCPNACRHVGYCTRGCFIVATDTELQHPPYRNRLKLAVLNTGIGAREWPTVIQDMFLNADGNGMGFQYAPVTFNIPLVDDVWQNERYVRLFLESQICEHPDKDRLIDLYFRVMMPDIAQHFGR